MKRSVGINRILSGLAALVCVAACSSAPEDPLAKLDPDAMPRKAVFTKAGPRLVDSQLAVETFTKTCVATAPNFRLLPAVLATMPIIQNKRSGTYYHRRYDIAIKLTPAGCTMTAGGTLSPADARAMERTALGVSAKHSTFNGRSYVSAVLTPDNMIRSFMAAQGSAL